MDTAIEGAAKLVAMVTRLERERDAALARAEHAEAALAHCQHDLATLANKVEQADAAQDRADATILELRSALADVYRRAERAEAALAAYEQQQWMARAIGAEAAEERMLTERAAARTPCVWTQNDDDDDQCWATSCGELHVLLNGGTPTDENNRYRGCPHCVRPIEVREVQP